MSMRLANLVLVAAVFVSESCYAKAQSATAPDVEQSSDGPIAAQAAPDSAATATTPQAAAAPAAGMVTVPAGTAIPLTLVSQIKSRSTKPGDTVRAMVAFPVTTGTQLAIPAGTYVEGTVTKIEPNTLKNKLPMVEIHFIRMLFANGYAVDLNANSTQARVEDPDAGAPARESARNDAAPMEQPAGSFSFSGQQTGTLPPLPPLPSQPNMGVIMGATIGGAAAATIGMIVWAHHRATHMDYVLFDSGWQFQMVLTKPLTLDASRVSAAASTPRAQ
ncbi:MAG TPA: hypothetical protein VGS10_20545 [Terracidiphilus sp.]|nr:hypothetical protein [Terracidiphilus sp.]